MLLSASRVVLGLGGCVDYELTLTADVLERLVIEYGIRAAELSAESTGPAQVADERDLVVSILGYVARGRGGEHFVASAPALETFACRFPHRETLGGTSVRAGLLMSRLGVPSTFHLVSLNDTVRRLLPADSEYISSGVEDTFHPHLIVQYDRDLRIRAGDLDITAPFPNRLIYVNDPANSAMLLADELGPRLRAAEVFLISGFNGMRDNDELEDRLASLRSHMRQLPPGAVTCFEDAAYHEPAFSRRVRDALLDEIDVYGMNEDEMQSYLGHPVDLLSAREVADALTALHTLIPAPTLVLHTKYWAAALCRRFWAPAPACTPAPSTPAPCWPPPATATATTSPTTTSTACAGNRDGRNPSPSRRRCTNRCRKASTAYPASRSTSRTPPPSGSATRSSAASLPRSPGRIADDRRDTGRHRSTGLRAQVCGVVARMPASTTSTMRSASARVNGRRPRSTMRCTGPEIISPSRE